MTRRIVFVGNCQMEVLRTLYDRFVAGVTGDVTEFLPSSTELDEPGAQTLAAADMMVDQVQSLSREFELPPELAAIRRVPVPLVSASFLWPYVGSAHPSNADSPFLKGGPYPAELGDGFLNRLIQNGVPAERALDQYRQHDLGGPAALNRRYELIIDQQRARDRICGFTIAPEIERHFRAERLFLSPDYPDTRIARALAAQAFHHMGAPQSCIDRLVNDLVRSPLPHVELPVHPTVARHFDLTHLDPDTRYAWHGEGRCTWAEWVLRYMACAWSPALFEGWSIAVAEPERAQQLLLPVVQAQPGSPLAHGGMAKALQALRKLPAALPYIHEATRLAPADPELARVGAFLESGLGHHQDAVRFAKTAAASDAGSVPNLQLLAKLQEDAGDHAGAEPTRRKALALQPHNAGLVTDLGTTLLNLGRLDDALAHYRQACDMAPHEAGAYFGASIVLARLGHTEEAINAVQDAVRLRPGIAVYFSHLGHLLLRAGRREDGIAAFTQALSFNPGDAGIHHLLADLMLKDHTSAEGLHHALSAAANAPGNAPYQVRAAHLLTRHLRLVEAIAMYRRAIALLPHDRTLHAELGALLVRLDQMEEAATELAAGLDPVAPGARPVAELAAVLQRMGRLVAAKELVDHAARQQPEDPQLGALQAEIDAASAGRGYSHVLSSFLSIETEEIVPQQQFIAPSCMRYTNFQEMNPTFGTHHVDNLYVEKTRWVPAVSLCRLPADTRLAVPTGEEFIPLVGASVVAEQVRRDWPDKNIEDALAACTQQATLNGPAVLIARYGIRTWGHWLGELLPKLVAVEQRWPGRFRYILPERIAYDPVHATAMESLAYYGIGKDRLILVPHKMLYACPNLYVVTSAWSAERMLHPEIAALMRTEGPREREPAPGWLKVALLRRSTKTRNIRNLAEVEDVLLAHGFFIADIETLNFRQQVDLFKNANAIVCVLGSGLSGLIYAPRGVKILTLAPGEWGDLFFYSMMQERDAVFADIRGPTTATNQDVVSSAGFTVPIEALVAGLAAIGLGTRVSEPEIALAS